MSRSIVFVNGIGETLTLDDTLYLITSIDGLGAPETDIQDQKAPYQDGTTFIDALYQPRDITVEIAIRKPNNFAAIDIARRELSKKLSSKNGEGLLTYTSESGEVHKIKALALGPVFPNKEYKEPFLRAQITFRCSDPYWQEMTGKSASLYPAFGYPAQQISATAGEAGETYSLVKIRTSGYMLGYIRASDNYLVVRTSSNGKTWSAETVVKNAATSTVKLLVDGYGYYKAIYRRDSDGYLCGKSSSDGITWSSEQVIVSQSTQALSIIQTEDGKYRVYYYSFSDFIFHQILKYFSLRVFRQVF